jgi:hypothetical protein
MSIEEKELRLQGTFPEDASDNAHESLPKDVMAANQRRFTKNLMVTLLLLSPREKVSGTTSIR